MNGPALRSLWRGTGADLPFGDPLPSHNARMEGYLWRFTDPAGQRVVLVACGINRHPGGTWATVLLAAEPGGRLRWARTEEGWACPDGYRLRAGTALAYARGRLRVDLGPGARLDAVIEPTAVWPRGALHGGGLFSLVPGLNHYWHPHLFDARVTGRALLGREEWDLRGAAVYAEKCWGRGFPRSWWWGQAHGFPRRDVCVAFAGGRLALGPVAVPAGAVVVRAGARTVRLVPPSAVVRASGFGTGEVWRLTARGPRHRVDVEGVPGGATELRLPIPVPEHRGHVTSAHRLAARVRVVLHRDGRRLWEGVSSLASLETGGVPPGARPPQEPAWGRAAGGSETFGREPAGPGTTGPGTADREGSGRVGD